MRYGETKIDVKAIEARAKETAKQVKAQAIESRDRTQVIEEAYNVQAQPFVIKSETLDASSVKAHDQLFEKYVESLNAVSAKLDAADRELSNPNNSEFRSLKIDEAYLTNAAFLHALYFENIGDLASKITMDSLAYMRLSRDFGTFDAWQEDFVACAMAARNGWAICAYNFFLGRYVNYVVDLHSSNTPINSQPVIVLDAWEHAYYREKLTDRKDYVFGVMREFNWQVIESRFARVDKLASIMRMA